MIPEGQTPAVPSEPGPVKRRTLVLAALLGLLPMYATLVILEIRGGGQFSLRAFIVYLAVIAPLGLLIVWALQRFLCRERLKNLELRRGQTSHDLLGALVLSIVIIALNILTTGLLSELFPGAASNTSVRDLFARIAADPDLMALFTALVFVGAASEEVIRTFFLSRLWKAWPTAPAKWLVVIVSAGLFGLVHLYQGPIHVAWASMLGLVMAFYYLRFGRLFPLILAHYLTNMLQLVAAAAASR